jgi:hypothetical protein
LLATGTNGPPRVLGSCRQDITGLDAKRPKGFIYNGPSYFRHMSTGLSHLLRPSFCNSHRLTSQSTCYAPPWLTSDHHGTPPQRHEAAMNQATSNGGGALSAKPEIEATQIPQIAPVHCVSHTRLLARHPHHHRHPRDAHRPPTPPGAPAATRSPGRCRPAARRSRTAPHVT